MSEESVHPCHSCGQLMYGYPDQSCSGESRVIVEIRSPPARRKPGGGGGEPAFLGTPGVAGLEPPPADNSRADPSPGSACEACELEPDHVCSIADDYSCEHCVEQPIKAHPALLRAERERGDRLAAEKELLIGQLLLGSQWTRQRWLEWLEGRFVATAALKEAKE